MLVRSVASGDAQFNFTIVWLECFDYATFSQYHTISEKKNDCLNFPIALVGALTRCAPTKMPLLSLADY